MAALLTCEKNNMTAFFHFLLALAVILALAWLVSYDRQKNSYSLYSPVDYYRNSARFLFPARRKRPVAGKKIFPAFFASLLGFAAEGTNFVFGGMSEKGLAFIFLGVLCPIVFISALIGILQHWRILPIFYSRDWHPAVESKRHG